MSVAPDAPVMDRRGIRRVGLNGLNDKPNLDVNFIAKGAVLTAGKDTYILNPLGISCMNIICGTPSIVYEEPGRNGIELTFTSGGCCGAPHYIISVMRGMKAFGFQDEKIKVGHTTSMKVGFFAKGPYYGITEGTGKELQAALWNDAGCLKVVAPLNLACKKMCEGGWNCTNLIKGRVTRNVHQPIFNGGSKIKDKKKPENERKQIGIITHSWVMAPISCFQAMPYRFLHMRVEITDQEWRNNAADEDYIRLAAFVLTTNGGEFELVDNFLSPQPDPKRATYTWAAGSGHDLGLNQWITYTNVNHTVMNGMIDIGNLFDKLLAMIKGLANKGKQLMSDAKQKMGDAKAAASDAKNAAKAKLSGIMP